MDTTRKAPVARRRGRQARTADRAGAASAPSGAVWPGVEGGRYRPLDGPDERRVHEAALHLLERVGLSQAIPSMVERVTARGGRLTADGRLRFPRSLVEDTLAGCRHRFTAHARRAGFDLDVGGGRVHCGSGGGSPSVVDIDTGAYRAATLADLYDAARVVDALDNVHFFFRSLVARDMPDPLALDVNTAYACLAGTTKHVGMSFSAAGHPTRVMEMLDLVAGGEGRFRDAPFCTLLCCHVVPPLRFAEDACAVLEEGTRLGYPVMLVSAGQAGATGPVTLAGTLAQAVAECLAGLVFVRLVDPDARVFFAPKPLVSDLRTGAMTCGSGEQAVMMAAAAQMGRFYDLPTGSMAGMTDSKTLDAQYGAEKASTLALAAHAGSNMISQACGMQASLLGVSHEGYVADDEMVGSTLRAVRGLEVSDRTLALDTIERVVRGEGHFLGDAHTLARMETDYLYPTLADRHTPVDWAASGARTVGDRARERARAILASHFPDAIAPEVDRAIRARLDIRLPRDRMRARA